MSITNEKKFKGEIENYLNTQHNAFESRIETAFKGLKLKTHLNQTRIVKQQGYSAAHICLMLVLLPMLKIKTVHGFCKKQWLQWSSSRKDTFYRFKQNPKYRWRPFNRKMNCEMLEQLAVQSVPQKDRTFIIDDTLLAKLGRMMENVSYHFDHNQNRSVLGYCVVTLGLLIPNGFFSLDFAYHFSKKRHRKSPPEKIGNKRSASGVRSYEAKTLNKLELALQMIQGAVNSGIVPGYVLFDSWYSWPGFINAIRAIDSSIHVVCRLKNSKVHYQYHGKSYRLSELYDKVKHSFKKDSRTGLLLKRVRVGMTGSNDDVLIVFSKGYREPEIEKAKGSRKQKDPKWVAFLSTDTKLHSSSVIREYIKRWPIEVCFKECKQMLELGKEQSTNFNAQVCATTISFLRYNLLSYLNIIQKYPTLGELFESIVDGSAVVSYAGRLWDFFRELFAVSFSKIFAIFDLQEDFHTYFDTLEQAIIESTPILGCET